MNPVEFPESNTVIGKPDDLEETQCASIPGCVFKINGGNLDGSQGIVVAWKPRPEEIEEIVKGGLIYVTFLEIITGHTVNTNFKSAINISS